VLVEDSDEGNSEGADQQAFLVVARQVALVDREDGNEPG
jgi:hypothetical protein